MKEIFKYPTDHFKLFPGESIEMVIRHHWLAHFLIFFRWAFFGPSFLIASFFFLYKLFPDFLFTQGFYLLYFIGFIFLLFFSIGAFVRWLNSIYDVIIVTNDRVVDITQIDFFHRKIAETRLENIQDASGNVKGVLNTLFNWGDITILTASYSANLAIEEVSNPNAKSRKIFDLAMKAKQKQQQKNNTSLPQEVRKVILDADFTPPLISGAREKLGYILKEK